MKILKIALGTIIISLCLSAHAQAPVISRLPELNTFMQSDYNYKKDLRIRTATIEGSPYLSEEFSAGSLSFRDTYYRDLQLRFNAYEGHFEFKSDDEVLYFDPRYTEVDTVWMENDKYIYIEHDNGRNIKRSYMKLLHDGPAKVLLLKEIILLEPEKASGYEEALPARFEPRAGVIYLQVGDKPALEFKNRRSIDDIFPDHANALEKYAKTKKLRFRDPEDLVTLVKYYKTLE